MVFSRWLERLGDVVAPDENYTPKADEMDTKSPFWQMVAPDPRFSEQKPSKAKSPPPSAFAIKAPAPKTTICIHCKQETPIYEESTTFPSTPDSAEIQRTPRFDENIPSDLLLRIGQGCRQLVLTEILEKDDFKCFDMIRKIFKIICNAKPIEIKTLEKLKDRIQEQPVLLQARSLKRWGGGVPNNSTFLMVAAEFNHKNLTEMLLNNFDAASLLVQVNEIGQTAEHYAAHFGSYDVLEYLKERRETVLRMKEAPVDLGGRTPYNAVMTSPLASAKKVMRQASELMFSPHDASILGPHSLPAEQRTFYVREMAYGYCSIPGLRASTNEDAVAYSTGSREPVVLVVCDGHSDGGKVSRFVADQLVEALSQVDVTSEQVADGCAEVCLSIDAALRDTQLEGGTTAIAILVTQTHIVAVNVGDSRAILVREQDPPLLTVEEASPKAPSDRMMVIKALSEDHNPDQEIEKERIEGAGLQVVESASGVHKVRLSKEDDVDVEEIAMSRAFGDFEYKMNITLTDREQAIVAVPDVVVHKRDAHDKYILLACDGVWDVMSNHTAGEFVANSMSKVSVAEACDQLVNECMENLRSGDNLSAIVLDLRSEGRPASNSELEGKALRYD